MSIHNQSLLNDAGILQSEDASVVIVYTEWNDAVINELVAGCDRSLAQYNVSKVSKVIVPGAFELPFACKQYWERTKGTHKQPGAIIAFGCVIRGETPHFDYVCKGVTEGLMQLNLDLPVPVIFGILTVDNMQQAQDRLGGIHGHKGEEAAITALKMISMMRQL
ncbi:6,7-dimethyl-8-ribityllumazine synthase [Chitinophaga pinensis]|uniref:6,7-dimethyl-8-ribityllumazine synthase n=1 Tax=Chitinophaga pinensis (strain ATCC 43595 / DSM 2588 / LMG 13176 / NBRC 15968 / NCIMB 11800 / UQM 2034) TaxID=485918 RepID=A0A979G8Z1_CHIPD|nr:6,7-dimethyl-8-ribityllumazine synthase [Chitinophaga pinensis]ACU62882.1 6,7-dimethyl-8-ribityllumazine synthase [Chitinophaga pinensis DSM 2588]